MGLSLAVVQIDAGLDGAAWGNGSETTIGDADIEGYQPLGILRGRLAQ